MKAKFVILLTAGMLTLPVLLQGQPSAHYVPGVEGIKGASLPPPGVYAKDYNVFYFADRVNDKHGDKIAGVDPDVFIYANIPRLIWITDQKVLDGYLGVDALIPLQYANNAFDKGRFGVGDLFAEVTLSWHVDRADLAVGYGVWMPTGDSSPSPVSTRAGAGFWTHMFTAGATYFLDADKKWALSGLCRYEINHEKEDTDRTPGDAFTIEWGASYALSKTVDVGVVGYYQQQVTTDCGVDYNTKDKVVGIGPEVVMFCPKLALFTSIRYNYEVLAEDRVQGHTLALTFTRRF